MMYAYQIISLIDIQFKIMINVLKKKKDCCKKEHLSFGIWYILEIQKRPPWSDEYRGIIFQVQGRAHIWGGEGKGMWKQELGEVAVFYPEQRKSLDILSKVLAQFSLSLETFAMVLYREWLGE